MARNIKFRAPKVPNRPAGSGRSRYRVNLEEAKHGALTQWSRRITDDMHKEMSRNGGLGYRIGRLGVYQRDLITKIRDSARRHRYSKTDNWDDFHRRPYPNPEMKKQARDDYRAHMKEYHKVSQEMDRLITSTGRTGVAAQKYLDKVSRGVAYRNERRRDRRKGMKEYRRNRNKNMATADEVRQAARSGWNESDRY